MLGLEAETHWNLLHYYGENNNLSSKETQYITVQTAQKEKEIHISTGFQQTHLSMLYQWRQ